MDEREKIHHSFDSSADGRRYKKKASVPQADTLLFLHHTNNDIHNNTDLIVSPFLTVKVNK
jgi:hypothetical protein